MGSKLNNRQMMFCKEYIIDLNATQAAIRAGYSEKTARTIGSKLLTNVDIQHEIQKLMKKRSDKTEVNSDDVLRSIKKTRDICERLLVKTDEEGNESLDSVALNGVTKNNEQLGKHLKLFTDKVEHSGSVDINHKSKLVDKYLDGD